MRAPPRIKKETGLRREWYLLTLFPLQASIELIQVCYLGMGINMVLPRAMAV